jgi:hypothetical protein
VYRDYNDKVVHVSQAVSLFLAQLAVQAEENINPHCKINTMTCSPSPKNGIPPSPQDDNPATDHDQSPPIPQNGVPPPLPMRLWLPTGINLYKKIFDMSKAKLIEYKGTAISLIFLSTPTVKLPSSFKS